MCLILKETFVSGGGEEDDEKILKITVRIILTNCYLPFLKLLFLL